MPELRVVLVMVPPLLADLIRHGIAARFAPATVAIAAEISDPSDIAADFRRLAPHVAILGPDAASRLWALVAPPAATRVLTLSPDLTRILGPGPADSAPLTPDMLAARLLDVAQTI